MLERFLERVSISEYKQNFILKGGMLIASMVGIGTRNTMDMDATIKGQTLTALEITEIVEDILRIPMDDGVEFTLRGIEEIREEADYPCYRVSIGAILDKTRQTLKVDITTGDFVTPKEIEYCFKLMFEDRAISIMAYNVETVLAEKVETIITRSVANTRMRDFYDIHVLTATQPFDKGTFNAALDKTAQKRGTAEQLSDAGETLQMIARNPSLISLWKRYQRRYAYAADISWDTAIAALRALLGIH